uniref:Uncharacterized protein n=1 Tax=Octopus bimaculoides TaxID=37653 RepID=A0A0L8HK28_OCTBM
MPLIQTKCSVFKNNTTKDLFSISCYKCNSFKNYGCSRDKNVPQREQDFLQD